MSKTYRIEKTEDRQANRRAKLTRYAESRDEALAYLALAVRKPSTQAGRAAA